MPISSSVFKGRRTLVVFSLLFLAVIVLTFEGGAETPPSQGNWTIPDTVTVTGVDIELNGWLIVENSGSLTLTNMTVTMNGSHDGHIGIEVMILGDLKLDNVSILSSDPDIHYWFICQGKVEIRDCDIRDVAANDARFDDWDQIRGGVQIFDDSSVIRNSAFHDSQRINMYVSGVSPDIQNCTFYNAEYVSTYSYYGYSTVSYYYVYGFFLDATGLYLNNSNSNIIHCTFSNNGRPQTALPYYNTSYSPNVVQTLGRGILAADSSPTITLCDFQQNGGQPADRSIDGVDQIFLEAVFYDYRSACQGGLVCVGASFPSVTRSRFLFNDLFGICGYVGGYPRLVEACHFEGNQYIRNNVVMTPSSGLYVDEGTGMMEVADCVFKANVAYTNLHVKDVDLKIVNMSTPEPTVSNGYNIYYEGPRLNMTDSVLTSGSVLYVNLYIGSSSDTVKVGIENSHLSGGNYGIFVVNYQGADILMVNSSILYYINAAAYLQSTKLHLVNCTIDGMDFEAYTWGRPSQVIISYFMTFIVTWQNGAPVPSTNVFTVDVSGYHLGNFITDSEGRTGPHIIHHTTITIDQGLLSFEYHSPVNVTVNERGYTTTTSVDFEGNMVVTMKLWDRWMPYIIITRPFGDQLYSTPTVVCSGLCYDVGSGMANIQLSVDDGEWFDVGVDSWNVTLNLPEGKHSIKARAFDASGNMNTSVTQNITVDLTPPPIDLLETETGDFHTNQDYFEVRFTTERDARVYVNGTPFLEGPLPPVVAVPLMLKEDGPVDLSIEVVDRAGHSTYKRVRVIRDTVPPVIHLERPYNVTNSSTVILKGWVYDEYLAGIWMRDRPYPNTTLNLTMRLEDGINRIEVEAWDKAGNLATAVWLLEVDTKPPVISVTGPTGGTTINTPNVGYTFRTDEPVVGLWVDGLMLELKESKYIHVATLEEGPNTFHVMASDKAGNVGTLDVEVFLDSVPPTIVIITPEDGEMTNISRIYVNGSIDGVESFTVAGQVIQGSGDFSVEVSLLETSGPHEPNLITIEAVDEGGNRAKVVLKVYRDSTRPVLTCSLPDGPVESDRWQLTGTITDAWGVSHVVINGEEHPVAANGSFAVTMPLDVGMNWFAVEGVDIAGNVAEQTFAVERVEPPKEDGSSMEAVDVGLIALMLAIGAALSIAVGHTFLKRRGRD
jgi:hypothetical protein